MSPTNTTIWTTYPDRLCNCCALQRCLGQGREEGTYQPYLLHILRITRTRTPRGWLVTAARATASAIYAKQNNE